MSKLISGIHHVTAISGDTQRNIDFYTGVLGLHLVKQTVNFDYPEVYHFYFGDKHGTPGTIMTTFPYGEDARMGRHGKGKISTTAFSVPYLSLDYWLKRLEHFQILYKHPQERFSGSEVVVYFEDHDGMGIELIFNDADNREPITNGSVQSEYAIRGIHHVELWLESYELTAALLTEQLNHKLISESSGRLRFGVENSPGKFVDLLGMPNSLKGLEGRGMVHHVAFSTSDEIKLRELKEKLLSYGIAPTGVRDRNYFKSIYFNEPGGILFEIATEYPGFTIDEDLDRLGHSLKLPLQFEEKRSSIEEKLIKFNYNPTKFKLLQ